MNNIVFQLSIAIGLLAFTLASLSWLFYGLSVSASLYRGIFAMCPTAIAAAFLMHHFLNKAGA